MGITIKKRLLSLILALIMTAGLMPAMSVTASAAAKTGDDGVTNWDFIVPVTHKKDTSSGGSSGGYIDVWDGSIATGYAGGSGSINDPYQIATAAQLAYFARNAVSGYTSWGIVTIPAYYALTNNIDLNWIEWTPVINVQYINFNGNGHTIKNLKINLPQMDHVGLFGMVDRSNLGGIAIENVDITGNDGVGAMVGICSGSIQSSNGTNGMIGSCSVSNGRVRGNQMVGGLAGRSVYTTANSSASVDVEGYSYVGGLIGASAPDYDGRELVGNCYATGNVSGIDNVGGLIGYIYNNNYTSGCYATGNVSGRNSVGGLIGSGTDYSQSIYDCFATGDITVTGGGSTGEAGGILGGNSGFVRRKNITTSYYAGKITGNSGSIYPIANANITNSYYDSTINSQINDSSNQGRTTVQMKRQNTFTGFDFKGTWAIDEDQSYPYLQSMPNPFEEYKRIYTARDLDNIRNNLSGNYILMNDIDLSSWGNWTPIGSDDTTPFTGIFDGNGYVIKNMTIDINSDSSNKIYVGLFGYSSGGIKNVGMFASKITMNASSYASVAYVGGIAGVSYALSSSSFNYPYIDNCYNTGDVSASSSNSYSQSYTGGIAGLGFSITNCYNTGNVSDSASIPNAGGITGYTISSITNCYNTGNVSVSSISSPLFNSYVGGITGYSTSLPITDCYNTGDVSAYSTGIPSAGGIVGHGISSITNCYNTGDVSVSTSYYYSYAGGISGSSTYSKDSFSISNCYNIGAVSAVSAASSYTGGIEGYRHLDRSYTNCYFLNNVPQAIGSDNGTLTNVKALTDDEMRLESSYEGFDFNTVWGIYPSINDGYPYLRSLLTQDDQGNLYYGSIGQGRAYIGQIQECIEDPVNMVNGNLTWEYTDFEIYGAQRLSFTRYYNAQSDEETAIGYAWRHSFDYSLTFDGDSAKLTIPNGYAYEFAKDANGAFIPPLNSDVTLTKTADGYLFVNYDKTQYSFNDNGQITKITDVNENITSFTYENGLLTKAQNKSGIMYFAHTNGKITKIWDDTDRSVYFAYDASGDLIKFTNADGDSLEYKYDGNHNLLEVSDFNGNVYMKNTYKNGQVVEQYLADQGTTYFAYDPANRVSTFTNATGAKTLYYYDENFKITHVDDADGSSSQQFVDGRLMSTTDYLGNKTTYEYDSNGNRTKIIYPDETIERYEYNAKNLVTKEVAHDGSETVFTYDSKGNMTSVTDALGNTSGFTYDGNNNLTSYTDSNGAKTSYTYDEKGNRTSVTDALGNITSLQYDLHGRLIAQATPKGEITRYEYSPAGKLLKITDPTGSIQTFEVNGNGYNTAVTDFGGNTVKTAYDKMNKPVSVTDAEGNTVSYKYNESGNLVETTDPMGNVVTYSYDQKGRLTGTKDALGNSWSYVYNANGQLTRTTDPYDNTSEIAYDVMSNVLKTTNARQAETGFTYDKNGRLTSIKDALGGESHTVYDKNGNIISQTDKNGNTWENVYDKENRFIKSVDPLGNETVYEYDSLGQLIKITSPEGSVYKTTYDSNGQVYKSIDPFDNVFENVYDPLGRLIQQNNPDGTSVSYVYDKNALLLKATDENGNTTAYTYNKNGQVLTITDALGGVTRYEYNKNGQVLSITDALDGVTSYEYDKNGNVLSVTDAMGGKTVYEYDKLNRVSSVTDAMGGVTGFKYDKNGNITETKDAAGYITTFIYDLLDRLISYTDAEDNTFTIEYDKNGNTTVQTDGRGNSVSFDYNALNMLKTVTDQAGGTVQYFYDKDGRTAKVINQEGAETSYVYDLKGRVISVKDALGNETKMEYDSMDRIVKTTDAKGIVTEFAYTKTGLLQKITDALGGVSSFEYDFLGRLISETNANGEKTSYTYDALGRVLSVTNPLGHKDSFAYDANGRITSVIDRNGAVTKYTYDKNGNLTQTTDALDSTSYFEYDKLNRLVKVTLNGMDGPDVQVTLYEYDGRGLVTKVINAANDKKVYVYDQNGNMVSQTDEDGYVTEYSYDSRNLAQTITYSGGKKVDYIYNKAGQLVEMNDWTGKTSFTLDLLGKITAVNDSNNKRISYGYDKNGNQTRVGYADGSVVQYDYDILNRLTNVTDNDGKTTSYKYDSVGRPIEMNYPNGLSEQYSYDKVGQLLETTQTDVKGVESLLNRYGYDPMGNIISNEQPNFDDSNVKIETVSNTFNSLNQLTSKTVKDEYNNITNVFEYTFDKRGNLIKEVDIQNGNATRTYAYDETNKMVKGVNANGETSAYSYNGLGYLVAHNGTSQIPNYTSYSQRVLQDGDKTFVYGLNLISVATPNAKEYVQTDRLGSVVIGTDEYGAVASLIEYDEWGVPSVITQGLLAPNYTGHAYDDVLGIYYAKARMYDPATSRMLSPDPIKGQITNPQSLNPYTYVLNNPVNYIDPDGKTPLPAQVVGRVYTIEGVMNGQSVWYVGSTAQELSARFSSHEWQALIKASTTTISYVDVTASLDITASGQGTIRSATNEALRSAEQQVINKMRATSNGTELNQKNAATAKNQEKWESRHSVKTNTQSKVPAIMNGVATGLAFGATLLWVYDMYLQGKASQYLWSPYLLEDQGGIFTIGYYQENWWTAKKYFKTYQCDDRREYIEKDDFDFWKAEARALWGYMDWKGDFVPGLLRPELPVIEVPYCPYCTPDISFPGVRLNCPYHPVMV